MTGDGQTAVRVPFRIFKSRSVKVLFENMKLIDDKLKQMPIVIVNSGFFFFLWGVLREIV